MEVKPIPAFYCCYLLRSIRNSKSLYIGSTPHPKRRLKQHNGLTKGGACRTARTALRPWEMACIVTGFPSKVAALQFEWAWNNNHISKHISTGERLTSPLRKEKKYEDGSSRIRVRRPKMTLEDLVGSMQILLNGKSFARWPLRPVFFCQDVLDVWKGLRVRNGTAFKNAASEQFLSNEDNRQAHIRATKDFQDRRAKEPELKHIENPGNGRIDALDVGYGALRPHAVKARGYFQSRETCICSVCHAAIQSPKTNALLCPHDKCLSVSHMTCLATRFSMLAEVQDQSKEHLLPKCGQCPDCHAKVQWIDLVRELSLRARGPREVEALLKPAREKRSRERTGKNKRSKRDPDKDDADIELEPSMASSESDGESLVGGWHPFSDTESQCGGLDLEGKPSITAPVVIEDSEDCDSDKLIE